MTLGQIWELNQGEVLRDIDITRPYVAEESELEQIDAVSLFKGKLADAVAALPTELKHLSEVELHNRTRPTPSDWKLRQNFTDLVNEARKLKKPSINTVDVYDTACTKQTFFDHILPNPVKVAWISRPIIEHTAFYAAIHREALNKIFAMVQATEVDPKYLPQILKLAETAGNRVYGPVVQKMQIQSKNLNVEMNSRDLPPSEGQEDLHEKIASMQAKLLEGPKDVTPKDG